MPAPEELSRDELIALVGVQAARIAARDARRSQQIAELMDTVERLDARLAKALHLLPCNSGNSSMPPSRDGDPGRTPPDKAKTVTGGKAKRARGKQPGARGTDLAWRDTPDNHKDRFPEGACACGRDLADAVDLGVVDRYQQHEIPLVSVKVTQFDQHAVACWCGRTHTASRPEGAPAGQAAQACAQMEGDLLGRVVGQIGLLADRFASSGRPGKVAEIPYSFGQRFAGESKATLRE